MADASNIYRGFTVYRSEDGAWRWTDPNGVAACQHTFQTEEAAMNDVDAFKRKQRQERPNG